MHVPGGCRLALVGLLAAVLAGCSGTDRSGPGPARPPGAASASPPSAAPTSPPPPTLDEQVTVALRSLDRRQQIAQLFMIGVPLDDLASGDALVRDQGVGGLFLRGRSRLEMAAIAGTTTAWARLAAGPRPWVAADQEGGNVQTLSGTGFPPLPTAVTQGGLAAPALAALADGLGGSLAAAGVNLDLAPVADVVPAGTGRSNAPIGVPRREYGSTVAAVTAAATTILDGLGAHGVTGTVKHFPGLGRVRQNTDTEAGVTDTVTTGDDPQVALFGDLSRSGTHPFVMVSTATYARIDPVIAAFSPVVVADVLRGRLGFDGVVISDDLGAARSVTAVPAGDRATRFLAAGGTMILTVEPADLAVMSAAVAARCTTNPEFSAAVDAAVRTALLAKARAGLLPSS